MHSSSLTQSKLKEFLKYDPKTGVFIRLPLARSYFKHTKMWKCWNTKYANKPAGVVDHYGYSIITLDSIKYSAHRLAFLFIIGEIPEQVDHVNHKRSDNRWVNLRPATDQINRRNQSISSLNTSGVTGVCKSHCSWRARIQVNRKQIELGCFDNIEDAIAARKEANIKYKFHPNHGNRNDHR